MSLPLRRKSSRRQCEAIAQVLIPTTRSRSVEVNVVLQSIRLSVVNSSAKQGRVTDTSSKSMGQTLQKVMTAASAAQAEFGDSFVSTEHLVLALAREDKRFTRKALRDQGADDAKVLDAVKAVRGPQKVTSRNPEAAYEVRSGREYFAPISLSLTACRLKAIRLGSLSRGCLGSLFRKMRAVKAAYPALCGSCVCRVLAMRIFVCVFAFMEMFTCRVCVI